MAKKKRTPRRIVDKFMREKKVRVATSTRELAKVLSEESGVSVIGIEARLNKVVRGRKLTKQRGPGGETMYVPKGANTDPNRKEGRSAARVARNTSVFKGVSAS